jgi:methionyl-tRNA synthetase
MNTVLYVLADTVRRVALVLLPFMPESIAKLLDQLAVPEAARNFAAFDAALAPGTDLPAPQGVFPRFVEEKEGAA